MFGRLDDGVSVMWEISRKHYIDPELNTDIVP